MRLSVKLATDFADPRQDETGLRLIAFVA